MTPVRRTNLTSQVMDAIKDYIATNNLGPGSRLPSEKDLTLSLNVSRNILREALKSLEAVGLIEIKVGDGMYVSHFDYTSVVDHISYVLKRHEPVVQHFIEARLIVEVGSLDLAAPNVTDEMLSRLDHLTDVLENAPTLEDGTQADLSFHLELLEASKNPVMMEFGSFLVNFFMKARTLVGSEKRFAAARGHRELVAALRARDAQTAKAVMVAHIGTWQPHKDD